MRLPAALVISIAISSPVPAQLAAGSVDELTVQVIDANPAVRMQGALAVCHAFRRNHQGAVTFLRDRGWAGAEWGGLREFTKDTAQILLSPDFFCDASDSRVSQAKAREIVESTLAAAGDEDWQQGRDETGCFQMSGSGGRIVVASAGQDPVCAETGNSAIRFWYAGED